MKKEIIDISKLSREEQKVAIAADIIDAITKGLYIPRTGAYVDHIELEDRDMREYDVKDNMHQLQQCEVCAIGACIVSITKYKNRLTFKDLPDQMDSFGDTVLELLASVFTPEELCKMEIAFEGKWDPSIHNIGRDKLGAKIDTDTAMDIINAYGKPYDEWESAYNEEMDKRMLRIMNSIIENKGEVILC